MTWATGWFWADFFSWWVGEDGRRAAERAAAERMRRAAETLSLAIWGLSFDSATVALERLSAAYSARGHPIGTALAVEAGTGRLGSAVIRFRSFLQRR